MVVGLAPVIALGAYEASSDRSSALARANSELDARSADGAALVTQRVTEARTALEALATNPVLTHEGASPEDLQEQLATARRLYPAFEDITLVAPGGQVAASTDHAYSGTWASKAWFRDAVRGESAVSPAHLAGAPLHLIVVFSAPVHDERGGVQWVLTGQIAVSALARPLGAVRVAIAGEAPGSHGGLCLLDGRGLILAGPKGVEVLTPSPLRPGDASAFAQYADGSLWRTTHIPELDWHVAAQLPEAEVLAGVSATARQLAFAVALVAAVVTALSIWLSKMLSGVVGELTRAIPRIGEGYLGERMGRVNLDEFRTVVRAFNEMAQRLQGSQHELGRSEEWFRSLVTHGSDVVWVLSEQGLVTYVGPSAANILRTTSDDQLLRPFVDLLPPHDHPRWRNALAAAMTGGTASVEHALAGLDAGRVMESHLADLRHVPAVAGIVVNMRDVTERKTLEADVERAVELDRLKTEFLGLASHELRTPLTGILGFSELLREVVEEGAPERQWVEFIVTEAERLSHIIDDLLNVSRIESGVFEVHGAPVNLAQAAAIAARSAGASASDRHTIGCSVPDDLWVVAEERKLVEVVENLLSNAIKYSPAGGRITVTAAASEGEVTFNVEDEGLGIPPGSLATLFERFKRVDTPDRAQIEAPVLACISSSASSTHSAAGLR